MKRFLASVLAVLIVISALPMSVFAAAPELNLGTGSCDYYNLIEKNDYNLAPGAVESEIILNDDSGTRRQVVHVVEVDPNNDNISVMPSFKNIGNGVDYTDTDNWGIMEMSKQAAYVEETLGKNVVGAMNVCLSWDFTHPYGLLVYEGVVLCDNRFSCDSCGNNGHPGGGYLVIYKDGKAELRDAKAELTGDEWMAQTVCFSFLVKDGKNLAEKEDHTSEAAPRSVIGVKADGSLVIMMVDGRMAPYSTGFTTHEMAQMMLDLGCVDAINCDGGGSSTFITEREGTGELSVKSRFSDGSERPTLTGIVIVSKAVADGKFDHASIEADNKLVTPGSTVTFTATGADSAGGPAEVPENVSWQLTDSAMGTITNGVFVSSGKTGSVTAQMVCEGNVVGEATVDVVIPDSFAFVMPNITAPYTKTVNLDVVAKYGHTEVTLKASDVEYVLSDDAMGTINGIKFTATSDESVKGGTVTATLVHNRALTATANITLGKGSEVVYDFESGAESIANWNLAYKGVYTPDKYYFNDQLSVASVEDGAKVRNGQYALKVTVDGDSITCMNWCQTKIQGMNIDLTDAVSLSFWIYIPEGSHGLEWDFGNAIPVVLGHEFQYGTGWQYLTVNVKDIGTNVTKLNEIRLYHSDTNNAGNGYNHYEHPNYYADVVYYIDDITVNYSSAVEDNDAPVISDACVSHANVDTGVAMKGQDINTSLVTFTAKATDNVGNTNYTGLNLNSLIVLVDGKQVNATCSDNGMIATDNIDLANGVHTVVFQIADNNGNYNMYKEYSINIVGNDDKNTIQYVPADPTLKDVLQDSVVWMNLVATAIDKVGTVTTTIDLDQNSKWELDHMVLADGFTAEYTIDPESNDATITITATGNVTLTGEAVIASLPIRVWSPAFINGGNEDSRSYRLVSVMSYVQMGELVETDDAVSLFASAMQTISTEWNSTRLTSTFDKSGWHIHTAEAVEDMDSTCTKTGYTGRTFCEVCDSVVDWGTVVPVKDHAYEMNQGKLTCVHGGELFTGVYTDGKTYIDGVVMADGWNGYSYYLNGVKLVGVHQIDGKYYDFGSEGICPGKAPMSLWYTNEDGESFYLNAGVPITKYTMIDSVPIFFTDEGIAYQGEVVINGEVCVFEKGAFVNSTTADVLLAGRVGDKVDFVLYANGTMVLCGEGDTWNFVSVGKTYLPNISWKNRPWGNQLHALTQSIKKVVVGKDITAIGSYLFNGTHNLVEIEFEEGSKLTSVGEQAFNYAHKLTSLRLPESVKSLAYGSFSYCLKLKTAYIPAGCTSISHGAFAGITASKLTLQVEEYSVAESYANKYGFAAETREKIAQIIASGECGDNVRWELNEVGKLSILGSGAMNDYSVYTAPWVDYRASFIKSIYIGKDITTIGNYAFAWCQNVTQITFEEGSRLEIIGNNAFHYMPKLNRVVLPETVKQLGYAAFGYGSKLAYIYIPSTVKFIHTDAFLNPGANLTLAVEEKSYAAQYAANKGYKTELRPFIPDVIYSGVCNENIRWEIDELGKLSIIGSGDMPNYTAYTAPWVNYRASVIKSIYVSKDIASIGNYAFAWCQSVTEVTFEDGSKVKSIGANAFHYMLKLKEIVLPETVKTLGYAAFGYGASLKYVYIPGTVTFIQTDAFLNPSSSLTLAVEENSYAYNYAAGKGYKTELRPNAPDVLYSGECGENIRWEIDEFGKLSIIGSGAMPNYTAYTAPWVDYRVSVIKSIYISKDITAIGNYAFAWCQNVTEVTFEDGSKVESIGNNAFHYMLKLKEIVLPESVKSIGFASFGYGSKLTKVVVPKSVSSIHADAFLNPNSGLVLYVENGSYAYKYAIGKGIAVELK